MTVKYISKYSSSRADKAVLAGLSNEPKSYVKGGEYGRGSITFSVNPSATNTITLNGVWVQFSAAATNFATAGTSIDPYILQIAVDLTTTLTNLATALNGSANTALTPATYANSGGTILTVIYDTLTATANAYTLAASVATVSGATLTGGQAIEPISLNDEHINIALTDSNHQYFSLAAGQEGQKKSIVLSAKGAGSAIIAGTFTGGTALTLDTANKVAVLQYLGSAWRPIYNTGSIA